MLNKYEKLPSRAPTAAALLGSSVPTNTMEEAAKTPGNDLLTMLGGMLAVASSVFSLFCRWQAVSTMRNDQFKIFKGLRERETAPDH